MPKPPYRTSKEFKEFVFVYFSDEEKKHWQTLLSEITSYSFNYINLLANGKKPISKRTWFTITTAIEKYKKGG